jgi:uncharacterized protein (DUF1778 family)
MTGQGMPQADQNDNRITARISSAVRERLESAAALSGATLNQFVVQAALKEANKILEEERVIVLSERDADTVFGLLENPPIPNARLQEAAIKHKVFFREAH